MTHARYIPPRPVPLPTTLSLLRVMWEGDGNLLGLLPKNAYTAKTGWLGWSRRSILIVNEPSRVRHILADPDGIFPKNDLMTGAVEPLIGESIFVSSGETWRRQRRMVAPAFSNLQLSRAFAAMEGAVDAREAALDRSAAEGASVSLDLTMSWLTADVICRTVFSAPLGPGVAQDVYEDFKIFERSAAHVELKRLILAPAFEEIPQHENVLAACARIREHLGAMVDPHLREGADFDDIASAVVAARDPETGAGFTRDELIDQLGVFFLAGHETSASALTWAFFIAATRPEILDRIRGEIDAVCGDGPIAFEHIPKLTYLRNFFKEVLRLYPPITFIPRVALEDCEIAGHKVKRGAMIMVTPWTLQRHRKLWKDPEVFDPDRWTPERADDIPKDAYIPFGLGPRICVGAAFAGVEAALILARLLRRYDINVDGANRVRPVARLTTRPGAPINVVFRRRSAR